MGRNNKIMREMEEKRHKIKVNGSGGGGVPPKIGFFLGRKGGVNGFKGLSGVNVWVNSRKCDRGQENEPFGKEG